MLLVEGLLGLIAFLLGAALFSFMNVVAWRLPRGKNPLTGRSFCPQCGAALTAGDLVPVFSWLFLRGRCRHCRAPIPVRYLLVELLGGVLALGCRWRFGTAYTLGEGLFGMRWQGLLALALCGVLLSIALIDAETQLIPNRLNAAVAVLAVLNLLLSPARWAGALIGMVCISVPMLLLCLAIPGAFGGGDIKLMAAAGLFLGWQHTLLAMFFGILGGGFYGMYLLAARKAALALVQKLADSLAGQTAQPGGQPLPRLMQQIELEHAGYRYTPGKPVLQDLSATLKAGKAYAVVGASGGGKSTLLRLLHIPDDNTSGQVLFDGIDIRRLTPESLNGLVSVVQQNVFVFNASIRDNITMFRVFPQETLDEVIRRAHLEELVARRGLDALCGAYDVALVLVQQFVDVLLVGVIVLTEDHILQVTFGVHQGQRVDLVVPDDVVAIMQAGGVGSGDQLVQRGHELGDLEVHRHAGQAVVAGGNDAQQLAVSRAVIGDGHGGVAGAGLQVQHIAEGSLRRQVGVRSDKALFVGLDAADHVGFLLDGLRAVDEGNASLLGQCNGQLLAGNGLHDGRDHRDVHFKRAILLALVVLDQRGLQADSRGDTLRRRIAGDQQILTKGAGRFREIICHVTRS